MQMGSEARFNRFDASTRNIQIVLDNSPQNLGQLLTRSPDETMIINAYYFIVFSSSNWTFLELPRSELPVNYGRTRFNSAQSKNQWSSLRTFFDPEFVEYIEKYIFTDITPELNVDL